MDYSKVLEQINSSTVQISSYDSKMFWVAIAGVAFSIIMSAIILRLTWRISKNQEELEKKSLKLQLFEKRYPLYETIVGTKTLLDLDNSDLQLYNTIEKLGNEQFINCFVELDDDFSYQLLASGFLFEKDFILKINNIKKDFELLVDQYLKVLKRRNFYFRESGYDSLTSLMWDFNEKDEINLKKDSLYNDIGEYKKMYDNYIKAIEDNMILEEFEKYLNVHDLEK